MAMATKSDMSATNLERVLRLPGLVNTKYPQLPRCRIIHISDKRYTPEEMDAILPIEKPLSSGRERHGNDLRSPQAVQHLREIRKVGLR